LVDSKRIGKSGAWPKIFGWKVRCLAENIRLESPVLGRKYSVGNSVLGRKYSVGKSGAWPKIFGWELEKVWKIFGLKLEKY
jgi:hypothetical protein